MPTNRYPGECRSCGVDVPAEAGELGKRERGRYGRSWTPVYCKSCAGQPAGRDGDADCGDADNAPPPVPPSFRHADGRRSITTYFPNTGAVIYQNSNGRCIDAPCCGCCS